MIKFNGVEWKILKVPPFHPCLRRSNGTYSIGSCDNITKTIYINQQLKANKFEEVVHHELLHAMLYSYNIKLTYNQKEELVNIITYHNKEIMGIVNKLK